MSDEPTTSTDWANHEGLSWADIAISRGFIPQTGTATWMMSDFAYSMYRSMMARLTWKTMYRAARKAGRRDSAIAIARARTVNGRLGMEWV